MSADLELRRDRRQAEVPLRAHLAEDRSGPRHRRAVEPAGRVDGGGLEGPRKQGDHRAGSDAVPGGEEVDPGRRRRVQQGGHQPSAGGPQVDDAGTRSVAGEGRTDGHAEDEAECGPSTLRERDSGNV